MAFSLVKDINQESPFQRVRIASQAYTIGDAVMLDRTSDAIDVVPATAASTTVNIYGVAMETVGSSATSLLICIITPNQEWVVDVTNNSNTNHNYQRQILTNKGVVNNTGTDDTTSSGLFMQTGTINSAASKKIIGKFLKASNITA